MNTIIRLFSGKLGMLVLGFFLTTGCGALINWFHTSSTWNREKKFELLTRKLGKHEELLSDLSKGVGARVFRLQRVLWALEAPHPSLPGDIWQVDDNATKRITKSWDEYYATVIDWNLNYRNYATRIRFFAGPIVADKFFAGHTAGAQRAKQGTVAGAFEEAHDAVKDLRDLTLRLPAVDRTKQYDLAKERVAQLYNTVDNFVGDLYWTLDEHARSDNPLDARGSRD
jgi:hypothetical protein